ncbi:FUSC family protein [Amycolatopsis suaedae]|uniref:FUSC family protein n=1 Tax=Amycolatopsis suaedae TaxID=2510978 RepID=A0A4Q7JA07_9PSEU|nr:FUSC family protein [Amycolatopsis suaedae]RZQ63283.1 FUSC family protein [Amycolatopsis suaedae]
MKAFALPVIILVVVGGVTGLGFVAGLGGTAILAGLTALFCLIAAFGGTLRGDLRLLAGFAPALVLGAGVPRLLGEVSHWLAIAVLVLVVFAAGLVPALGQRYVTVGLGLGLASAFGYGFQLTGSASPPQVLGAPALAVAVAVVIRVLAGLRDPAGPARKALADALTGEAGAADRAARLWLTERPRRWSARVLGETLRYRAARDVLDDRRHSFGDAAGSVERSLAAADEEAARIAELVRARSAPADTQEPARPGVPGGLPGASGRWLDTVWSSLDAVRTAATERDESTVDLPKSLRRRVLAGELRGALSWRSAQLRHAVRVALGMAIALSVATLRPGDPLTVSFLMTTFAIMQPEWRDSLSKAWQRVAGSLGGAVVLALVIWLAPPAALLVIGVAALLVGIPMMTSKPMVFNGCVVLMSVGVNATNRHLDPAPVLVEYLLLIALAVVIGLLFGFAAVPGVRKPGAAERFTSAVDATRTLYDTLAGVLRGETSRPAAAPAFRHAARAQQDLLADEPGGTPPSGTEREKAEQAADALRGLYTSAIAAALPGSRNAALAGAVAGVAAALPPAEPDVDRLAAHRDELDGEQRLLLDTMQADLVVLHRTAP